MTKRGASVLIAVLVLLAQQPNPAQALSPWPSAPYAYPSSSYVGPWLYGTNGTHTGADLWGNTSGSGGYGPTVFNAYAGYVRNVWWLWDNGNGTYTTRNYACTSGRCTKYGVTVQTDTHGHAVFYWHMADQATFASNVDPAIALNYWYPMGTKLGNQGNATGVASVILHLHFTVGTDVNVDSWGASLDPSPWIGPALRDWDHVPTWTYYEYNGPILCDTPPCPTP